MKARSQIALSVAGLVAGVSLLAALAYQFSFSTIVGLFQDIGWHYVVAALLFGFFTTFARVARYCLFFPFKDRLRLLYVTFVYIRAALYVLPFRLGEPVALYMLKRFGLVPTVSSAAPAWTLFRLGDVLALLILLLPALPFMPPNESNTYVWFVGISGLILIGLVLLSTWRYWVEMLSRQLARHTGRLSGVFSELRRGLETTTSHARIALSVVVSLLITTLNVFVCVFALWALDLPISLAAGIAITVVAQATNSLPFRPPLGIGLSESVWTGLLVLSGLSNDQAFAGALAVRFLQLALIVFETAVASVMSFLLPQDSVRRTSPGSKPLL